MVTTVQEYQDFIIACDSHLKAGRIGQVELLIKSLNFSSVPREFRQSLAKLCRRSGLIAQGLRLLHPVIRNEKSVLVAATPGEICEYAALLSRNGSIAEALTLLDPVDSKETPEALFYAGYCHISNWQYAKAEKYFENFLNSSADDYMKLIARVNLAASYIVTSKLAQASDLLTEAIELAEKAGATRLVGNGHELWGQVYFWLGNYEKARESLKKASLIFGDSQSYDQLLINKTEAIMSALEQNSVQPLQQFKDVAVARSHRESVREADLFLLKVNFDQHRMDHLIFGTPMLAYRERIQNVLQAAPSETYLFGGEHSKDPQQRAAPCLDLKSGIFEGNRKRAELNPGKKIHQVLVSLLKDYYVPRNLGTLFAELYPGEFFDTNSSPFRVRQLMMRTRQWLKENKIPASILHEQNAYSMKIDGAFAFRIHLESPAMDSNFLKWQTLQSKFTLGQRFTAEQACEALQCSRSSFARWAEWALAHNKILRTGINKAIRYSLAAESSFADFKKSA